MGNSYTVELRQDQWDLIVMCLEHVRTMTQGGDSAYAVDRVGRKFLRQRAGAQSMTEPVSEEVQEAVASVGKSILVAKFTIYVLKPLQWLLTMAYLAAGLYGGTWIVVLALRHSGVIR